MQREPVTNTESVHGKVSDTTVGEFLTFTLGSETYGVEILKVREINQLGKITPIANTAAFLKGIINLRGLIVPLVDLRIRFNLPSHEDANSVVIILSVHDHTVGIVVDGVSEVVSLGPQQIKPAPTMCGVIGGNYVQGIGVHNDRMLLVIDIDRVLSDADMIAATLNRPGF